MLDLAVTTAEWGVPVPRPGLAVSDSSAWQEARGALEHYALIDDLTGTVAERIRAWLRGELGTRPVGRSQV